MPWVRMHRVLFLLDFVDRVDLIDAFCRQIVQNRDIVDQWAESLNLFSLTMVFIDQFQGSFYSKTKSRLFGDYYFHESDYNHTILAWFCQPPIAIRRPWPRLDIRAGIPYKVPGGTHPMTQNLNKAQRLGFAR